MRGNQEKIKLAILLLFTLPGAPAIYYGDEVGVEGGKDPDCRRAFPWKEKDWIENIRTTTKDAIMLRKTYAGLRTSTFENIFTDDTAKILAFSRGEGKEKIMIIVNASQKTSTIRIQIQKLGWDQKKFVKDHLKARQWKIENHQLSISIGGYELMLLS